MIWPFSASSKKQALSAAPAVPAIPTVELVLTTLARLKEDVLALNFVHADPRDATTRGSFLAIVDRFTELARSVDWTTEHAAKTAQNLEANSRLVVKNARDAELASSFTKQLLDSAVYYRSPFNLLSMYWGELRQMAAENATPVTADPHERATFPSYTVLNGRFGPQLEALAAQWQVRADQELSIEDRYLVDALANSYLPESIHLYASLAKDPAFAEQAGEMFAKQLTLYAERLATIEDATAARQLQAMAVHSAFLEERMRAEPALSERLSIAR